MDGPIEGKPRRKKVSAYSLFVEDDFWQRLFLNQPKLKETYKELDLKWRNESEKLRTIYKHRAYKIKYGVDPPEPEPYKGKDHFSTLPEEMVCEILNHLDDLDINRLSKVNKRAIRHVEH